MTRDLSRLLRPRSIAVIGGGAWCANVVAQCRKMGFAGDIWPVHPRRSELGGVAAYAELADLPGAPDAAFIGVNRHATIEMTRALALMGAGGAVCFASGFSEAQAETGDGADLQAQLLQAAGAMPVIGPNCYGFVNYLDGALLWPDQHGGQRCDSGRRDPHAKLQHRAQPHHAGARPAAGLCADRREPGADRPCRYGARASGR